MALTLPYIVFASFCVYTYTLSRMVYSTLTRMTRLGLETTIYRRSQKRNISRRCIFRHRPISYVYNSWVSGRVVISHIKCLFLRRFINHCRSERRDSEEWFCGASPVMMMTTMIMMLIMTGIYLACQIQRQQKKPTHAHKSACLMGNRGEFNMELNTFRWIYFCNIPRARVGGWRGYWNHQKAQWNTAQ